MSSHNQHVNINQRDPDEIDLLELVQQLWREKLLIGLITLAITILAAVYAFITPPLFASQLILSSAPIGLYGELMAKMQGQQAVVGVQTANSAIALGQNLSNDAFDLLGRNLESRRSLHQFTRDKSDWQSFAVTVAQNRKTPGLLTVNATGPNAVELQAFLNQYLVYVASQTKAELNLYFKQSFGAGELVTTDMLYTLEQPAVANFQPVKPRKPLIMTLGFVLGGMLGVFVALVRGLLKKNSRNKPHG